MAKAILKIRWAPDREGRAGRTNNEVPIVGQTQFVQVHVAGRAITVIHDDFAFGKHPNGGSMIPLRDGQSLTVETSEPYPGPQAAKVVAMKHRTGRLVKISDDGKKFALA